MSSAGTGCCSKRETLPCGQGVTFKVADALPTMRPESPAAPGNMSCEYTPCEHLRPTAIPCCVRLTLRGTVAACPTPCP